MKTLRLLMYVHTEKAIKRGLPDNLLFLVSESYECVNRQLRCTAYKCQITNKGIIHPGKKTPMSVTALKQYHAKNLLRCKNGAEPTADFYPDSFYRQVDEAELQRLISSSTDSAIGSPNLSVFRKLAIKAGARPCYGYVKRADGAQVWAANASIHLHPNAGEIRFDEFVDKFGELVVREMSNKLLRELTGKKESTQ